MFRGITTFKCTQCGEKFKAPDFEYAATIYSVPQPCPKCGSIRTHPAGMMGWIYGSAYKKIWERMESRK